MSIRCWLGLLALALGPAAQAAEQAVAAYNSYIHAPFVQADGTGLAQDMVDALNRELQGQVRLTLENVPRERLLKHHLTEGDSFAGVVLFLAPAFVDDPKQTRWLWTRPIFEDSNVLVFADARSKPVKRLEDLKGLRFGAMLGNRYAGLDEMAAAGQLSKETSTSELALLRKLYLGRVDFAQLNQLMFFSLAGKPEFGGRLTAVPQPGQPPFSRRIFVSRAQPALAAQLDEALARLNCDKQWLAKTRDYGIELAPCARR